MISWLEVTQIPFEYTESYSSSQSGGGPGTAELNLVLGDAVAIGTFTTEHLTRTLFGQTNNLNSFSSEYASYKTINESGTTTSFASGFTSSVSISQNGGGATAAVFTNWFGTTLGTGSNTTSQISSSTLDNTFNSVFSEFTEFGTEEATEENSDGSSFAEQTALKQTTTQETQEVEVTITTESESFYTFVASTETSTTTVNSTGGSATSTTWTTTASQETTTTIVGAIETSTIDTTVVTELDETVTGNAFNTIYEAAPDEVIYMASEPEPLLDWGGIGQTVSWVTRTTRSADQTTESVYARDSSATESSSLTIPESTSSIIWSALSSYSTERTVLLNLVFLPHETSAVTETDSTTETSSRSGSTGEEIITYNQTTKSAEVTYFETITLQRYRSSLEFQTTSAIVKASTRESAINAAGVTYTRTAPSSGETSNFGGETTIGASSISLGIHAPGSTPSWTAFGSMGAAFGEAGFGLSYTYTGNVAEITLADYRRSKVVIFPATNETYTANDTGLTWRPNTDETSQTQSAQISAAGEPQLVFLDSRTGLLGGRLKENEFVVQRAGRALYQDASGSTTWLEGNDTSYESTTVSSSWLQPKYWMGAGGAEFVIAPRYETRLPGFVAQQI